MTAPLDLSSNFTAGSIGGLVRRQWWVVVVILVVVGAGSVFYAKSEKPSYSSSALVTVGASQVSNSDTTETTTVSAGPSPEAEVQDPTVIKAAATAAKLSATQVHLSATIDNATQVVTVSASAPTGPQAVAEANAAATSFVVKHVEDLNAAANDLKPQVDLLQNRLSVLQRTTGNAAKVEAEVVAGSYQAVVGQQTAYQLQASSVAISAKAVGASPSSSKKKLVELALVAGLLIGCAVALLRDRLDDKIRSAAEVGADVLVELPVGSEMRLSGTIADDPFGRLAEAMRELRTSLRFLSVENPLKTLLITSAGPGDGKSFVAINLAAAWAISGVPTVLVSSDLRRPSIENSLATVRPEKGLSEIIADAALNARQDNGTPPTDTTGNRRRPGSPTRRTPPARRSEDRSQFDLDRILVPTEVEGLFVLPAGPPPPNPAELLGSSRMGDLLRELQSRVEMIVLDSPPVLAVTDPLVLTAHADGVLFVVSKDRTSRHAVRQGLRVVESGLAPLFGVVMNRSSRPNAIGYYGEGMGSGRRGRGQSSRFAGRRPAARPARRAEAQMGEVGPESARPEDPPEEGPSSVTG